VSAGGHGAAAPRRGDHAEVSDTNGFDPERCRTLIVPRPPTHRNGAALCSVKAPLHSFSAPRSTPRQPLTSRPRRSTPHADRSTSKGPSPLCAGAVLRLSDGTWPRLEDGMHEPGGAEDTGRSPDAWVRAVRRW
jgi:hypothetical protein